MGRHIPQGDVPKFNTAPAKAVSGMVIQALVGGQQVHCRVIRRSIPALSIAQVVSQVLHALPVVVGQEQRTKETPRSRMRVIAPVGVAGNGFHKG